MNHHKGQIWYERALFYGQQGDEVSAKKAYSIARHFDSTVPPLPRFRNHNLLRRLERACLITVLLLFCWLAYLLFIHPLPLIRGDFPWWIRHLQGDIATVSKAQERGEFTASTKPARISSLDQAGPVDSTLSGTRTIPPEHTASNFARPLDETTSPSNESEELRPFFLLRTALYHYVHDHGGFPGTLDALVEAEYLTAIPSEAESGRPQVFPELTGEGGWVYTPPQIFYSQQIDAQVERALQINRFGTPPFPFAPLTLKVERSSRRVTLLHGDLPLKSWVISIGMETTPTPTGRFRITEKQILADDGSNPYGSRWMQIGETSDRTLSERGIGIHGTDQPDCLGEAVTTGCVRMRNADIEELYQWIPNGVSVEII